MKRASYISTRAFEDTTQIIGRSRAERQLDSIFHKQAKSLRFLRKKQVSSSSASKQIREAPTNVCKKIKTENSAKVKSENIAAKSPVDALHDLVIKHIPNSSKFPRAVDLVKKLWHGYISKSNKVAFMCAVEVIVMSDNCTNSPESRQEVIKFLEDSVLRMAKEKLSTEKNEKLDEQNLTIEDNGNNDDVTFDNEEIEYLETLCIKGIYCNKLFTDDAYQFNKSMSYLKNLFDELNNEYMSANNQVDDRNENMMMDEEKEKKVIDEEKEKKVVDEEKEKKVVDEEKEKKVVDEEKEKVMAVDEQILKNVKVKEEQIDTAERNDKDNETLKINDLNQNAKFFVSWKLPNRQQRLELKRMLFFDSLKTIFFMRNMIWARSSVEGFFQNVYINRRIFNKYEQDQISYWQSELKTKTRSAKSFDVYRIGEAVNPVIDGREERIVTTHGSVVWSAKQTGM